MARAAALAGVLLAGGTAASAGWAVARAQQPQVPDGVGGVLPDATPPGAVPPGGMPSGAMPPDAMPPGAVPPSAMPPGAGPGEVPPGGSPGTPGATRSRVPFRERFAAANTTHDGRLTLAQAQAAGMRGIVHQFDAIDTGHQGYVTLDQIRAFHRARRAARAAASTGNGAPQ